MIITGFVVPIVSATDNLEKFFATSILALITVSKNQLPIFLMQSLQRPLISTNSPFVAEIICILVAEIICNFLVRGVKSQLVTHLNIGGLSTMICHTLKINIHVASI